MMPLWLAAYLIVAAIVGTIYTVAVLFMATSCVDRFRVITFSVFAGLLAGLLWPIAVPAALVGRDL